MTRKIDQQFLQAREFAGRGRHEEAARILRRLTAKERGNLEVWFLYGTSQGALGQHAAAEQSFRQVLRLDARVPEAHFNLGLALRQQGRLDEAVAPLMQAIKLRPAYDAVYANLVEVLDDLGRTAEAAEMAERWLDHARTPASVHYKLGVLRQALADAAAAKAHYGAAIAGGAELYGAHLNLGVIASQENDYLTAAEYARLALRERPRCAIATYNLAYACLGLGEVDAAIEHAAQSATLDPGFQAAHSLRLYALNLAIPYDAARVFAAHRAWGRMAEARCQPVAPFANSRDGERRLRIGYVSNGFHHSPVAVFIEPLFKHHDRARFEIYAYATSRTEDAVTTRLKECTDGWCDITGRGEDDIRRLIRQDGIDILVDLDGHTSSAIAVFACRSAPLQIAYLGYSTTTGLTAMDYRVTDGYVDPAPDSDASYSERLLRLERCFFAYQPPDAGTQVAPAPHQARGQFCFGSFSKLEKINAEVIALWSEVLKALPESHLYLQSKGLGSAANDARMRERFAAHGISGERLTLRPSTGFEDFLRAHAEVDLILDTVPWNGHTNTCHALWMGVPTLTLEGQHHAGRFGASIMSGIGHPEFVTRSQDEFVERARQLAQRPESLAELRRVLRAALTHSPLCDGAGLTHAIEQRYRDLWQQWCNQQA